MGKDERFAARIPCPLLDEASGLCTVHAVRPLLCAGWGSTEESDCAGAGAAAGLAMALERESAAERWLAGLPVFVTAREPED